jgi:hypothetical protein
VNNELEGIWKEAAVSLLNIRVFSGRDWGIARNI